MMERGASSGWREEEEGVGGAREDMGGGRSWQKLIWSGWIWVTSEYCGYLLPMVEESLLSEPTFETKRRRRRPAAVIWLKARVQTFKTTGRIADMRFWSNHKA